MSVDAMSCPDRQCAPALNPDRRVPASPIPGTTGSVPSTVSSRCKRRKPGFPVGGEGEAGPDVFLLQFRVILQNLRLAHARGEPVQHIIDGNPHGTDAGLATPLSWFDGDAIAVIRHAVYSSYTFIRSSTYDISLFLHRK